VLLAAVTVTAAPVAPRLAVSGALDPTFTVPKLKLPGVIVNCPADVPVPESPIFNVGFGPLDVIVNVPLTAPLAVGANAAVNVTLCVGFSVVGKVSPLIENPAPLAEAAEIVTAAPPVFVSVSDKFELLPTCTLPNARLAGFGLSVPSATPVPETGIVKFGFDPFDVIDTDPLTAPAAVGANFTVNEVLCPAFSVIGSVNPAMLNPAPLAEPA
jgi:hypothetical protein